MFKQSSNNLTAIILAITGFSAFSVSDASSKWLTGHYPPLQVIGFVAVFSFATAMLLSPALGGIRKTLKTRNLRVHLARGILNAVISLLIVTAFSHMPIALVYTLVFITPLLTTLFAIPVYGEKVHKSGWIAIATGFAGVLVVLRPGFTAIDVTLFLPLLAAVLISFLFLLARGIKKEDPLISLPLFPVTANFVLIMPVAAYLHGLPGLQHLPFFMLSGVTVVIGLTCTAQAFRMAKASLISPFLYSQMIWAVFFGYVLFADTPDPWTLTGAAIIIGSGIYLIETERRASRALKLL